MQTVSQIVNDVSYVLGVPRSRVNSIARALVDAGVLPKSSGRDIKKVNGEQFAGLVAAVAMAEKVEQAPDVAKRYMALHLNGKGSEQTFADCFDASVCSDDSAVSPQLTFSKTANGFVAELEGCFIYNGETCNGKLPFWEARSWGSWTRNSFTLSSEGFNILRNLFRREYGDDGRPVDRTIAGDNDFEVMV